jgi:WD40 repeat protein
VLGLLRERTDAHSDWVTSLAFSPDGTKIVSGSHDRTIKVWDSGAPECGVSQRPSPAETDACPACLAGVLKLLGKTIYAHRCFMISSVAFSPDGTKIASGSSNRSIKVWDLVKWSRRDHSMFNLATRRFVVLLLWLNKYSMKFPDDVIDLLIEACM